jgi:hypothetical protein
VADENAGGGGQGGGGQGGNGSRPPPPRSPEERELDALIFWSDLNETYLLLDFVSGRPDRNFDALTVVNPRNARQVWHSGEVISEIAKIRYPPEPNPRAQEAAVLLAAKDQLSRLADPARALTIAYTEMFVHAETDAFWLRRLANWLRPQPLQPQQQPVNSRIRLASGAFPGLQEHARTFRRWRDWLMFFSVIWFGLTALTYWDASYGRSVLQRLDQFWKDRTEAIRSNVDLSNHDYCTWYDPDRDSQAKMPPTANKPEEVAAKNVKLVCGQLWYLDRAREESRADLDRVFRCEPSSKWYVLHVWCWRATLAGGAKDETEGDNHKQDRARGHVHWESANSVLLVFTTYILPMMFGVLGTLIGAFRAIQAKVRDSELAPRDLSLAMMSIPMGAVAGVAVGLYFSPTSLPMPGSGGVAGELTLSASGIGFLAGYGVQTFFRFIDWVLTQLFPSNQAPSRARPAQGPGPLLPPQGGRGAGNPAQSN